MKKLLMLILVVLLSACSGASSSITTDEVVTKLKDAGLEAESPTEIKTKEDYGVAPMLPIDGKRILVPSLGEDAGGRIFIFDNKDDLRKMKAYYDEMGKASGLLFSWTASNEDKLVLLQMNGDMEEGQFKKYEEALNNL
jgi:hypothetical protein